jgi:hypothetical protein
MSLPPEEDELSSPPPMSLPPEEDESNTSPPPIGGGYSKVPLGLLQATRKNTKATIAERTTGRTLKLTIRLINTSRRE